jgi:DNA-binding MarR family transcriptional regulator
MTAVPQFSGRANAFFRLFVLSQLMGTLLDRELDDVPDGFAVYSAIGAMGRITPSDLARLTGLPAATLTGYIDRLGRRGLVRRVDNPDDRRSYLLELTDEGVVAWHAGGQGLGRAIAALDRHLDRPVAEVLDALEALDAALRAALEDSTTP